MINVLFLCLGNICRSPMAEAVFRDLIKKEGLADQITVDSAGIGKWHVGNPPHEGTRTLLDSLSISYEGMKARQIGTKDFHEFDYIIAMDDQNIKDLNMLDKGDAAVTIAKLMDFVTNPQESNVPDPYYTDNFDYTYELVQEGCTALLKHIKEQNNLE